MVKKPTRSRGFTLIEMLVVVGIIVVVTSVVLANNSKFGGTVLLQNLAYDIALSTREAQIYGVSVKRFQSSFTAPFGVHFETGAGDKAYIIFADTSDNGHYDSGELLESTAITRGFYIGKLCVTPAAASEICSDQSGGPQMLDIIYKHPDPDAYVRSCTTTNSSSCTAALDQRARIVVTSPRGDVMNICVDLNGQISVHTGDTCEY